MMKILIAVGLLLLLSTTPTAAADELDDVISFLAEDQTDTHEYLPWYTCGHYSRDLARNASNYNLSIGSVILSNHPMFGGKWNSHIVNYVVINESIIIIDPQTDSMFYMNPYMLFDGKSFRYYRLYPDGTQVPSNWDCNLAHTGIIE